ncbi:CAP domain-containing protein [Propionispora hippei]|uniref:Cysteine-rich secretory protein family protein n=1 Tax=Propionispora hippei DSM 15287 TaxID=1123003 RepID=A0A1M6LPP6_9FIRM|nr:CAP domain-containing protein [Propionispora hippei]SHJ73140.1 Cysteine-rich secretory protein family protein [Propionispora hippei DSM 15287]
MKKLHHDVTLGLLSTTLGLYMMTASALPVYAANSQQQVFYNTAKTSNSVIPSSQNQTANNVAQDPLQVVKASANKLGFNAKTDTFSLVKKSATQAIVSVNHQHGIYNVVLQLNNNKTQWNISSITKINDSKNNSSSTVSPKTNNGSSSGTTGTSATTTSDVSAAEQQAAQLMNADRRANGLADLKVSSALTAVARSHSQDMVTRSFFSHTNPDGKTFTDRLTAAGISYTAAGENIAENTSVEAAETAFMNSSGHRANILNANYTTVGIGVAYDSQGKVYVTQDFIK